MKSSKIERLFAFVCALVMAASMFAVGAPALAEETTANDEVPAEAEGAPEAEANEAYTVTFTATVETGTKTEPVPVDKLPYELDVTKRDELLKKLFGDDVLSNAEVEKVETINKDNVEVTGEDTNQKISVKQIFSEADKEQITFTIKPANGEATKKTVNVICQKSITQTKIAIPADLVFDGNAKKVTVTDDGDKVLVEGTDYSAEYKDNNINAGKVTCTVTGKGAYMGSATKTFEITKATLTVTAIDQKKYEGDVDPSLTYTVDGLGKDDKEGDVLEVVLIRKEGEAVGEYDILQDKLVLKSDKEANYEKAIKFNGAKLTIAAKPVITFDGNPGENPTKGEEVTGKMDPQTVTPNVATKLAENAFKRSHFDFVGWNTAADGSGTAYADMAEITTDTDVTLYAQWKRQVFAITFDANGGSGTMDKQTMECSIATKLNENKYSRDGYTFKEWNTKADGTGLRFKNKETVRITKDITLYAQWTKKGSSSGSSSSKTSGSSSSSSTSSNATLAKTADPTSLVAVATMAGAGVAAVAAGTRKKRG